MERSCVCNTDNGALEEKGEQIGNNRVQKAAVFLPVLFWWSLLWYFLLEPTFCLLISLCLLHVYVQRHTISCVSVVVRQAMEVEASERGG